MDPSALGHLIEGTVGIDPVSGRHCLMVEDHGHKTYALDPLDLLAAYEGKEVRLTLISFEHLNELAQMAEERGIGQVAGVTPEDFPEVSFDIRRRN